MTPSASFTSNTLRAPHARGVVWATLMAVCAALLGVTATGCVTIGRHEELEGRVIQLEQFRRVTKLQLERDVKRLENLNNKLKKTSKTLKRDLASLAARVDGQADGDRAVTGRIEELDYLAGRMSAQLEVIKRFMDERFGLSVAALPPDIPTEAAPMLAYGKKRLEAGQLDVARAVLRRFINTYPDDPAVPRANLMVGDSYHRQKRFKQALKAYYAAFKPFTRTPASKVPPEGPKALWLAAKALEDSGECKKAIDMYKFLGKQFRKTALGAKARDVVKNKKCK